MSRSPNLPVTKSFGPKTLRSPLLNPPIGICSEIDYPTQAAVDADFRSAIQTSRESGHGISDLIQRGQLCLALRILYQRTNQLHGSEIRISVTQA